MERRAERSDARKSMKLNKGRIVQRVRETVRLKRRKKSRQQYLFPEMDCEFLSRRRTSRIVDTLFEILKDALTRGEDVMIRGFGKFQVKFRWARTWMNPRTGEKIILPSRRSVTFKASPVLRRKLNSPPDPPENST